MKHVYNLFCLLLLFICATDVSAQNKNITEVNARKKKHFLRVPDEFSSIQEAINRSRHGDVVLVAPGKYQERIDFKGKNITVASHYFLHGNLHFIKSTIIDASHLAGQDTASVVLINKGEDSTAVLQGFTITGGTGTVWQDEHGPFVYVEGGGILIQASSPVIKNNHIVGNNVNRLPPGVFSTGGAGIRVGDGAPKIIGNLIEENEGLYGGGIVMNYATGGEIKNNIIAKNIVRTNPTPGPPYFGPTFGGGGIWVIFGGKITIENNTIVENSSQGYGPPVWAGKGGGIIARFANLDVRNNIIRNNTQEIGDPVAIEVSTATVEYNNIDAAFPGTGNINTDPLFFSDYYLLKPNSPSADAGDPAWKYNDPTVKIGHTTLALFPSMKTARNDMGVYGGPNRPGLFPAKINGRSFASGFCNFPNPVNGHTTFTFELESDGEVSLKIFDFSGTLIKNLLKGKQRKGKHSIDWAIYDHGSALPEGLYIAVLSAGGREEKRIVKIIR
jgi:hypothetical protein